ncbi:hypothetical protein [Chromobacterium vaccinii]|uniref:hypothetical protein n=1 Tax=Chromobacterium vaccinii TaxID=1108595 RepID=UPI0011AB342E|nr:hypothetical protein [Chromobacterium vaccinii]
MIDTPRDARAQQQAGQTARHALPHGKETGRAALWPPPALRQQIGCKRIAVDYFTDFILFFQITCSKL